MKHPDEMDEFELIKYHTIVDDAGAEEEAAAKEAAEEAARPAAEPVPADAEHTAEGDCPVCAATGPCKSEFIDGSYTHCGCCPCEADWRAENPDNDDELEGSW